MVTAIRHWALACQIIDENDELGYSTTSLGDKIFADGD